MGFYSHTKWVLFLLIHHREIIVNKDAGGLMLADQAAKTISLWMNGSSMRCTVLLGTSMSGEKLASLVVFKRAHDARIKHELNNQKFAYLQLMVYCCQTKALGGRVGFFIMDS